MGGGNVHKWLGLGVWLSLGHPPYVFPLYFAPTCVWYFLFSQKYNDPILYFIFHLMLLFSA